MTFKSSVHILCTIYLVQSNSTFFIKKGFPSPNILYFHTIDHIIENNFTSSIENQKICFICSHADILLLYNNFISKIQFIPIFYCKTTPFFCIIPMTIFTNSIKILKIAKIRMNNTRLELVSIQEMWTKKNLSIFYLRS